MSENKIQARRANSTTGCSASKDGEFKQLFKKKLKPCYLTPGKYDNNGGRMSTHEDFKEAEWHGEEELNGD
ncbi:MAG TPA: hypothetical protein VFA07_02035 [Chthonomonadaceae bacterium]|nr:hypothetical protein [Chthonomonadaceae bacterium]